MSKKFPAFILAVLCASLAIAGCSDDKTEDTTPEERKAKFDSDLLCGFQLTFYEDVQTPIEELNKPLESGEAVASYIVQEYHGGVGAYISINGYDGDDIFLMVDRNITHKTANNNYTNAITLEETLFLTHEFSGNLLCFNWLYYNEENKTLSRGNSIDTFTTGTSAKREEKMSADGVNEKGEIYTINYEASVKFNIEYIDLLSGVKILEYGNDNTIIKTTDFVNDGQHNEYTPSEECDYIIVEEEYTDKDEKNYSQRTLINKDKNDSVILKFPYKSGLAKPTKLNIKW